MIVLPNKLEATFTVRVHFQRKTASVLPTCYRDMQSFTEREWAIITNPTARNIAEQLLNLDHNGEPVLPIPEPYVYDERKERVVTAQVRTEPAA